MRAIVIGSVESSRVAIEAVARHPDWALPLVITLPPSHAYRHSDYVDLAPAAYAAGAELLFAANVNAPEVCAAIRSIEADNVFVIGWSQICREAFMAAAGDGLIGYHPAPLPRMRGRAVIPWTILKDEPITGGTLFWIDAGVDSGPVLEQGFFHVAPDETAGTLYRRHMRLLDRMMERALTDLARGSPRREAQDERFASWTAARNPDHGRIDWRASAQAVDRLIRAVGRPYPGARTSLPASDADLVIWSARLSAAGQRHCASPGQVVAQDGDGFTVLCGDGQAIDITEWEGGNGAMPRMHLQLGIASCRPS